MSGSHWIVAPIVLPLLAGALALLLERRSPRAAARGVDQRDARAGRDRAWAQAVAPRWSGQAYLLGNWQAPFGIALVLDRLSALMLALTAVVAVASVLYACGRGASGRHDERGPHFHALFQFQLMGLNGAFLTADLFNLFVFFEVLLIASYGLLLHGAGPVRLRASVHYVVFNLAGSALFLIAVSTAVRPHRNAEHGRPRAAHAVRSGRERRLAAGGGAAADRGLRGEGGDLSAVLLADRHLRRPRRAGGGAVRHHDQGRRLLHRAFDDADVRRRGGRGGVASPSRGCRGWHSRRWRWPRSARSRRGTCVGWWPTSCWPRPACCCWRSASARPARSLRVSSTSCTARSWRPRSSCWSTRR